MKQKIAHQIKDIIKDILNIDLDFKEIENIIEIPPKKELGDYALPCFTLAKKTNKNPNVIANEIKDKLIQNTEFEKVNVLGPYINIFINKKKFSLKALNEIINNQNNFGFVENKIGKILIEFPSPNTNKPLHLGHLRNMAIGESISRLLEYNGNKVIRVNLYNDRGIHICKSMLAYKKYGEDKQPDKKPDHFVGDYYVIFNNKAKEDENLNHEVQEMLIKWEQCDKDVINLWKKMNNWVYDGFEQTYRLFGIKHDKHYYESEIFKKSKKFILQFLKNNIFSKRKDGAIIINLKEDGMDEKVLLRADGTSIYITQDLYLAIIKDRDYNPHTSIYIVGNEQDYHFKALFTILKKIGFQKKLLHLSYGMVELPDGRMKSREGNVVDADNIISEVRVLAVKELLNRYKNIKQDEVDDRALKIALSTIKYSLLKTSTYKNVTFDPKESVSFNGDTGPYLLYSYARAKSIIEKKSKDPKSNNEISEHEYNLIKKMYGFPEIVKQGAKDLNPSIVAHFAYGLCQQFNEFYQLCPVINSDNEKLRIKLVTAFAMVLKKSMYLMGIETLESM